MINDGQYKQRRKADLRRLQKLIGQGKFRGAVPFARQLAARYPDETIVHIGLALCLSETGQRLEALDILKDTDRRFPDNPTILFHLAETYSDLERFEKAEETYRKSLDLTPVSLRADRSECYNGIGVALWHQHRREEALEMWKLALKENPGNKVAKGNLGELTNEFSEPVTAAKPMDDFRHFQNIQMERYLQHEKKSEFSTMKEAEAFFSLLMDVWNTHLAQRGKEIDSMTAAEKTELFKSVKIDYPRIPPSREGDTPNTSSKKSGKSSPAGPEERKLLNMMNKRFAFLPPDTAPLVITFGARALIAAGMESERLIGLFRGDTKATVEEKDMLLWVFDIVKALTLADAKKDTPDETGLILKAISIAKAFLPEADAVDTVHAMRAEIQTGII